MIGCSGCCRCTMREGRSAAFFPPCCRRLALCRWVTVVPRIDIHPGYPPRVGEALHRSMGVYCRPWMAGMVEHRSLLSVGIVWTHVTGLAFRWRWVRGRAERALLYYTYVSLHSFVPSIGTWVGLEKTVTSMSTHSRLRTIHRIVVASGGITGQRSVARRLCGFHVEDRIVSAAQTTAWHLLHQ